MKSEDELEIYSYVKKRENIYTDGYINLKTGVYTKVSRQG